MSASSLSSEIVVIGGGVIGLAVAARVAEDSEVFLVEKFPQFGRETSSRNSEVIHSGIYYPEGSNKGAWCIEGRDLLYGYCEQKRVPFKRCGKYVVAVSASDEAYLEKLSAHCRKVGVEHRGATGEEIREAEPFVKAVSGIYFPLSGIVDSHSFMAALERDFIGDGGSPVYCHEVKRIERKDGSWSVTVEGPDGAMEVVARRVVNCAGLGAAELSNQALKTKKYAHRFCRGRYFTLASKYKNKFHHLIYPVPEKDGLGVHVTLDQEGFARLGPDVDWCEKATYADIESIYDCDWGSLKPAFLRAAQRYSPDLGEADLSESLIGVRPKLFLEGKAHPDFLVENHDGFIHCLGIESPGLTASLRIADEVHRLLAHP